MKAPRPKPEFRHNLRKSQDLEKYWHLFHVKGEDGKPARWPNDVVERHPVDIPTFFGLPPADPRPIEVEIGCGKGGFLVEYATKHPDLPILGIENEAPIAFGAADRIARRPHLPHARLVLGDAFFMLRDFLPPHCVQAFHMYFPDPWPKKRHLKLRLMQAPFLEVVRQAAQPDALFYWGTDHQGYHEEASALFAATPWLELVQADAPPTEGIQTNFEKKYRAQGKPIYRCVMRVKSG
jgi:tRNA (guanine-N7-)-methyltransferase